jgi:hypothetical protein
MSLSASTVSARRPIWSASSLAMACLISSVARRVRLPGRRARASRGTHAGRASERSGTVVSNPSGRLLSLTPAPSDRPEATHGCPDRHHDTPSGTGLPQGRPVVVNANPHVLVVITTPAPSRSGFSRWGGCFFMHGCRHLEDRSSSRPPQCTTKSRQSRASAARAGSRRVDRHTAARPTRPGQRMDGRGEGSTRVPVVPKQTGKPKERSRPHRPCRPAGTPERQENGPRRPPAGAKAGQR